MAEPVKLLDYAGAVDHQKIDSLLDNLKKMKEFADLDKVTGKRTYAVIVECLENMAKHSEEITDDDLGRIPSISVVRNDYGIAITTGNPVSYRQINRVKRNIDLINRLSDGDLLTLYDSKINKYKERWENGAGLGFMLMKLKSGNRIEYSFTGKGKIKFFEMKLIINHNMKKLNIDKSQNSPRVIMDPDLNRYEISGESRPPDVEAFYHNILRWFDDYSQTMLTGESREPMVINLDFDYFNSSSAKYILDFCKRIAGVRAKGRDIIINWHYENDDTDMLQAGKEMSKMAKFPFEFINKDQK